MKEFFLNPKTKQQYMGLFCLAAAASAIAAIAIDFFAYLATGPTSVGAWYNKYWLVFFFICLFVPCCAFIMRKKLGEKPDYLFLVIVLSTSLMFSWSTGTAQYSWDDGIHYRNVLAYADPDESVELSVSEYAISYTTHEFPEKTSISSIYDREFQLNYFGEIEKTELTVKKPITGMLTKIAYLPSAAVMFVCESLNAPFSLAFVLAKMAISLCYSIIVFLGMRKLREGKMLYAAIALLPTAVFLAADYSYDWWVNAFGLYGLATLASIIQNPDRKISLARAFSVPAILVLAALPKLVYAPLALLAVLIPNKSFKSRKSMLIFKSVMIGGPLLVCLCVVAYFATGHSIASLLGNGDMRGGSDISTVGQFEYITNNPVAYLSTLVAFICPPFAQDAIGNIISGYLAFGGMRECLTHYAYMGVLPWPYCMAALALLAFTALTDKRKDSNTGKFRWIFPSILFCVLLACVISSMYIVFTGVGSNEIHGVQGRYLIPLIYPLLLWVGGKRFALLGDDNTALATKYNASILLLLFTLLASSWWIMYISRIC